MTTLKYRIKEHAHLSIFNILPPVLALNLFYSFINFWSLPVLRLYSVFPEKDTCSCYNVKIITW